MHKVFLKLGEIKDVCLNNKWEFLLLLILVAVVLIIRLVFFEAEFPFVSCVNFLILLYVGYKLNHIAGLLKCIIPAVKHVEILVNGKK